MTKRSASFTRVAFAALCLVVLVVGGKGVLMWTLSRSIDAQAAAIGTLYEKTIAQYAKPLTELPTLTTRQRSALTAFAGSDAKKSGTYMQKVDGIIEMQRKYMSMLDTVSGQLASRPEVEQLQEVLSRGGGIQPMLDAYNQQVQKWNIQRESGLGAFYARLLGLEPKLPLQADGKAGYETTVTF